MSAQWKTKWLGQSLISLEECDSTNDEAFALAKDGADHGTCVSASMQKVGRGRMGRSWFSSDAENLYLSVVLRPEMDTRFIAPISLAAGVAVCDTINGFGVHARLKWPNDVLVAGKKIAGILSEMRTSGGTVECVVLGIGVNLNTMEFPDELKPIATSIQKESACGVERHEFLQHLFPLLEERLDAFFKDGVSSFREEWTIRADKERFFGIEIDGEEVMGKVQGLDEEGALLFVSENDTVHRVISGELVDRS